MDKLLHTKFLIKQILQNQIFQTVWKKFGDQNLKKYNFGKKCCEHKILKTNFKEKNSTTTKLLQPKIYKKTDTRYVEEHRACLQAAACLPMLSPLRCQGLGARLLR